MRELLEFKFDLDMQDSTHTRMVTLNPEMIASIEPARGDMNKTTILLSGLQPFYIVNHPYGEVKAAWRKALGL